MFELVDHRLKCSWMDEGFLGKGGGKKTKLSNGNCFNYHPQKRIAVLNILFSFIMFTELQDP